MINVLFISCKIANTDTITVSYKISYMPVTVIYKIRE